MDLRIRIRIHPKNVMDPQHCFKECTPQVKDAVQDAAVLEEVLRMLLEIINSCIVNQVSQWSSSLMSLMRVND
jgi:hypothetical protein